MGKFSDQDWNNVIVSIKAILGEEVGEEINTKPVAKVIASIGYVSGSEDPDRFAVSNLLTYWGAIKNPAIFSHRETDDEDFGRRLRTLSFGEEADYDLVLPGLDLLQLVMISNYVKDKDKDLQINKYNPVVSGAVNPTALTQTLTASASSVTAYTDILPIEQAVLGLWS